MPLPRRRRKARLVAACCRWCGCAAPCSATILVSMPFVNYGGPLGDAAAVRALAAHAAALARRDGVKLLELRSRVPAAARPSGLAPQDHGACSTCRPTPARCGRRWAPSSGARSSGPRRKASTVRFGPDQVEPFYAVFAEHMRDLGTPAHAARLLPGNRRRRSGTTPGSGAPTIGAARSPAARDSAGTASSRSPGRPRSVAYNRLAPNMLLYWAFMERAVQAGRDAVQLRPLHAGRGHPPLQAAVGLARRAAVVVSAGAGDGAAGTPSPDDARYAWGPGCGGGCRCRSPPRSGPASCASFREPPAGDDCAPSRRCTRRSRSRRSAAGARAASDAAGPLRGRRWIAALDAEYAPRALLLTDSGTSALALALSARRARAARPGRAARVLLLRHRDRRRRRRRPVPALRRRPGRRSAPDPLRSRRALAAGARTHRGGAPVRRTGGSRGSRQAAPPVVRC